MTTAVMADTHAVRVRRPGRYVAEIAAKVCAQHHQHNDHPALCARCYRAWPCEIGELSHQIVTAAQRAGTGRGGSGSHATP